MSPVDLDFEPKIVALSSLTLADLDWFQCQVNGLELVTRDYRELLARDDIEAVYCAVPHNLHEQIYRDTLDAGKHLLGEKPFGIDQAANTAILASIAAHPDLLVRCSSEFPFFPGAYRIARWAQEGRFGKIIEVEAGFWHSSDLDPRKPINWKRQIATNGEYGCLGDLGMHVVHLPFRLGWLPADVRALLSKIVTERPGKDGALEPCETWDNAIMATRVRDARSVLPHDPLDQAHRARPRQHLVHPHRRDGAQRGVLHEVSQADAPICPMPPATSRPGGCWTCRTRRLQVHHRPHLRVRLFRRHAPDVRGLLR